MTEMIVLRRFRYAGKSLKAGSRFAVSKRQDVKILSLLGKAKEWVPEPLSVTQSASPEPARLRASPPVSQSDQMTGEPADRMIGRPGDRQENPSEAEETEAHAEKPSRRYRRRDMKAEDV